MKNIFSLLLLIMMLLPASASAMSDTEARNTLASLQNQLATVRTPADSLRILYDIYDVAPVARKAVIGKEIFAVAGRAGDTAAQLDIIRNNSNRYSDDTNLIRLEKLAASLPASREQRETRLFLRMHRLSYSTRRLDSEKQFKELSDFVARINDTTVRKPNAYDRLFNLYAVTCYLRNNPESKMLTQYLDSMVNLVNTGGYKLYALRNLVLSEAARIYTDAGMADKAVKTDRELLKVIADLETHYRKTGRKYRNYNVSRYIVYRRMLRNYKSLSPAEVEDLYARISRLTQSDSSIMRSFRNPSSVEPYYLMARGRYADAIPLIKKAIPAEKSLPQVRLLYEMLQTAARQTGDTATLVSALTDYQTIMSRLDSLDASYRYLELQMAYDMHTLKDRNTRLRLEKSESETSSLKQKIALSMSAWIIIAILIVILLFYWTRYRSNLAYLSHFASLMNRQRDMLKDERYSDYQNTEKVSKALLRNRNSSQLVRSILSDIMYVSALGRQDRQNHINSVSISCILNTAAEINEKNCLEGATVGITYPDPDFKVSTDPECLTHIVAHIFDYAQSHSTDRNVNVTAWHSDGSDSFIIKFTHEGSRIARGQEESLFTNFVDWDSISRREDSALFICRMIAFLMQCTISYNPHREAIPTLVLSFPMDISSHC